MIGSLIAGVGQAFLPEIGAGRANWAMSPGWQREVGLWNLGLAVIIALALARGAPQARRDLTWGLVVLAALLGAGHAIEGIQHGWAPLHVSAFVVNTAVVVLGVLAVVLAQRRVGSSHAGSLRRH